MYFGERQKFSVFRELTLIITTLFFRVHVLQKEIHVAKVVFGLMNLLSSIRTKFIQNTLFSTQKYYYYFLAFSFTPLLQNLLLDNSVNLFKME